ncbi:MAG: TRAP transporter large permease subunit [Chloroflexi bacterium]|nr:TRAP transporter large permease subunit [Chloroflexota bacterium]
MTLEWLAIAMFAGFFLLLMSGYPVAYSFVGTALVFGGIGFVLGAFNQSLILLLPNRWFGTMSDIQLIAIPYFIFLGAVLEKSGLAEELLETVGVLFGPMRGGIALAVIVVGTLLAATTGVVAATIIAMGLISLPTMLKYGYNKQLASGVIISSGTLAQMIPPSLVLVVLSDQIGISVGDLFVGALVPGLMMSGAYMLYVIVISFIRPQDAPALPPEARTLKGKALFAKTMRALVPPFVLIFAVLGSIFFGLATPSEAGSVGAVGALVLTVLNRRFSWSVLVRSAEATLRTTALVLTILFCSTFFSLVFDGLGGTKLITTFLVNLPGGYWSYVIVANIVIFLLGVFLEFTEIAFIAMPILVPAARELQIDLVWFGVVVAINLQTAFISPPVGFSLFYLQSVAPKQVPTLDIHKGAIPFMILQLIVLVLVILLPGTVQFLVKASATGAP